MWLPQYYSPAFLTFNHQLLTINFKLILYPRYQPVNIPRTHRQQDIRFMLLNERKNLICRQQILLVILNHVQQIL